MSAVSLCSFKQMLHISDESSPRKTGRAVSKDAVARAFKPVVLVSLGEYVGVAGGSDAWLTLTK